MSNAVVQLLLDAAVAAAVTLALTPVVRAAGLRLGIVAHPGGRHVHRGVIPRIGGVAMFFGIVAGVLLQLAGERFFGWHRVLAASPRQVLAIAAGAVVMFVVGVVDDVIEMNPGAKFLGQIVAALVVALGGLRIGYVGNPFAGGVIVLGALSVPLTVLWIVSFANVINLIDGLDGLAAGVSAIAGLSLFALAVQGNTLVAALLAGALVGACVGFLRYNFHPASVFMGDSGALTLGYMLACISLLGVMKSLAAIALVVPIVIVGVPVFDTFSAIVRRKISGKPIQAADKGHIHHRLLHRGFSHTQTVLIIYVWSAALAIGGYAVRWAPPQYRFVTLIVLAALSGSMARWLGLFEVVQHDDEVER
ncbi:undecaprenyl/decaprenyl-phosphate alpha-N-acetylglucosaminyl 1-phosphate transferase [Coriobacteriia bacterium Es71-Z0120]|uniref:MraY family glycosyltransferase n=1 Tax=Parvivirga hydrogeniphila TaxID=2939460 RepID=UPI0022609AA4|nr:MraY family glycosyltransferase [Parvivirga hydrogeniphila]MCL4078770.1 undecaprenyl/decaprenyl-phosphate alpha-N-acetylglucosaminyl 1-phosphate transferase [Parvivirga hydrogeniphila]